ncbi:hypothetical protein [Pelagicoccus albus]|uniref:Uncharacterized protein n=1 Tax=Pelagicoccus albus TaxID=415222 RepID=A0A7X1E8V9_9BACT|nr:hypothetical protein [Pelagicoccus albus]MBC2605197.1 hypothetical protein [Pelagicoccus albus]
MEELILLAAVHIFLPIIAGITALCGAVASASQLLAKQLFRRRNAQD